MNANKKLITIKTVIAFIDHGTLPCACPKQLFFFYHRKICGADRIFLSNLYAEECEKIEKNTALKTFLTTQIIA